MRKRTYNNIGSWKVQKHLKCIFVFVQTLIESTFLNICCLTVTSKWRPTSFAFFYVIPIFMFESEYFFAIWLTHYRILLVNRQSTCLPFQFYDLQNTSSNVIGLLGWPQATVSTSCSHIIVSLLLVFPSLVMYVRHLKQLIWPAPYLKCRFCLCSHYFLRSRILSKQLGMELQWQGFERCPEDGNVAHRNTNSACNNRNISSSVASGCRGLVVAILAVLETLREHDKNNFLDDWTTTIHIIAADSWSRPRWLQRQGYWLVSLSRPTM